MADAKRAVEEIVRALSVTVAPVEGEVRAVEVSWSPATGTTVTVTTEQEPQ